MLSILRILNISDSCYTDFTKMSGTVNNYLNGILSTRECAYQCQMNSGENKKYKMESKCTPKKVYLKTD